MCQKARITFVSVIQKKYLIVLLKMFSSNLKDIIYARI